MNNLITPSQLAESSRIVEEIDRGRINPQVDSNTETLVWCCERGGWAEPEFCWGQMHHHYDVEVDKDTGKTVTSRDEMVTRHAEAVRAKVLPPPLPGSRHNPIDASRWPWGPIVKVHEIGPYAIVEYLLDYSSRGGSCDYSKHGAKSYATYVEGKSTKHTHDTLDAALAHCIAYAHDGINTQAHVYFIRGIGADTPHN